MNEFIVHLKEETGSTHLIGLTSKFLVVIADDQFMYDFSLYCKFECPDDQYFDSDSKTCKNCLENCETCTTTTDCSKCADNNLLLNKDSSTTCVTVCPAKYYASSNDECDTCLENCETCTTKTDC